MFFALSLLLAGTSVAGDAAGPVRIVADQADDQTVVVTGTNLKASGDALARCLDRSCPPKEDIAASMAHAENQFIAGKIEDARATLIKARSRNKRYAKSLPLEVSGLLQFDADVASMLGLSNYGRIASFDAADALKAGLPAHDPQLLIKRLAIGDVFLKQNRYKGATGIYDSVAKVAAERGLTQIQGAAMFRSLRFYATAASVAPEYREESRKRYEALRATRDPALQALRDASLILEAKLELLAHDDADVSAVMGKLAGIRATVPFLVFSPQVDIGLMSTAVAGWAMPSISRDQWVDFEYRIVPDGTVADITVTQEAPHVDDRWTRLAYAALSRRRYLPLALSADAPGLWRRERFMIVADVKPVKGTRISIKSGKPKLMTFDLTPKVNSATSAPTSRELPKVVR